MKYFTAAMRWMAGFVTRRHVHEPDLPTAPRKVRIVSDGTPWGTSVTIDGSPIHSATRVTWSCGVGELATATVDLYDVEVDVVGRAA